MTNPPMPETQWLQGLRDAACADPVDPWLYKAVTARLIEIAATSDLSASSPAVDPSTGDLVGRLRAAAAHPYKGPADTDSSMLFAAAGRVEGGYAAGGSNTREVVSRVLRLVAEVVSGRPWTPDVRHADGSTTVTVKRCCNGCRREIGDVTDAEMDAAVAGRPLPDVRAECGCLSGGAVRAVDGPAAAGGRAGPVSAGSVDPAGVTVPVSLADALRIVADAQLAVSPVIAAFRQLADLVETQPGPVEDGTQ